MQFNLEAIQSKITTHPNSKGTTYQKCEFTYKNLSSNKVESKVIVSFTNPKVYQTVAGAKTGQTFQVTQEKGEKYWEWKDITQSVPSSAVNSNIPAHQQNSNNTKKEKSTFETSEERAKKQLYIVRQSSIANAISCLSIGSKTPPSSDVVLELAKKFEEYVFDDGVEDTLKEDVLSEGEQWPNDDIPVTVA